MRSSQLGCNRRLLSGFPSPRGLLHRDSVRLFGLLLRDSACLLASFVCGLFRAARIISFPLKVDKLLFELCSGFVRRHHIKLKIQKRTSYSEAYQGAYAHTRTGLRFFCRRMVHKRSMRQ